jgi:hypothetical protein
VTAALDSEMHEEEHRDRHEAEALDREAMVETISRAATKLITRDPPSLFTAMTIASAIAAAEAGLALDRHLQQHHRKHREDRVMTTLKIDSTRDHHRRAEQFLQIGTPGVQPVQARRRMCRRPL